MQALTRDKIRYDCWVSHANDYASLPVFTLPKFICGFRGTPEHAMVRGQVQLLLALHIAHARCVTIVPPAVVQLGLAGLAGALGAICVYPIDLVKTRLQSTAGGTSYDNAFEVDEMMTKEGGLPALYKGIRPQLVGVVPEKTIKLFVHDAARRPVASSPAVARWW